MLKVSISNAPVHSSFFANAECYIYSMDGLFLENGPYRVNPDLSLNISAGGWQDHATIVFRTGFIRTTTTFAILTKTSVYDSGSTCWYRF